MPIYEYECDACGHRFEKIQKFSDAPIDECPNCGQKKVHKLLSSPAIQFKGSGWYITDYARKGGGGESKGGDKKSDDSKTAETKATDTKTTESKPAESKPAPTTTTKD